MSPSSSVRLWGVRITALVVGGLLGAAGWRWVEPVPHNTRLANPARAASAGAAASNSAPIALDVQREGRMFRLEWDAAAIRGASHAILHITDGKHRTELNLTSNELNEGLLSYWPDTADVTFRLEVFGADLHTGEAIGVASILPAQLLAMAAPPLPSPLMQTRHGWARVNPHNGQTAGPEAGIAYRSESAAPPLTPSSPAPAPVPAPMEPLAAPTPKPAASMAAPAPSRSPDPRIEVSAEAAPPARWRRVVRHIPLVRRLKKQQQVVVPPEPIDRPQPTFSIAEQRDLRTEVPIDVRVYITESGLVDFAELLDTRSATQHRDLASAAVFAARRWNFRPARLGEEEVPSEAILHFRFKPAEVGAP